jgi:hypothetical protein
MMDDGHERAATDAEEGHERTDSVPEEQPPSEGEATPAAETERSSKKPAKNDRERPDFSKTIS